MKRNSITGRLAEELRIAYVWNDEVMADAVAGNEESITIGPEPGCTFTTPELGIAASFPILAGDSAGHTLTLCRGMSGQMSLAGNKTSVSDFLAGQEEELVSAAIAPGDWGVIELDGTGDHNLFFQFVSSGPVAPPARWRIDDILAPALAFAIVLHAVFLTITYVLKDDSNHLLFPGSRSLMTGYLVKRPPPAPPPSEEPEPADGTTISDEQPVAVAAARPKKRRRQPSRSAPASAPGVPKKVMDAGLLKHRKAISDLGDRGFDKDLHKTLSRLQNPSAGGGPGSGPPGIGDGPGTRSDASGGGNGNGKIIATGDIDTGGERKGTGGRGNKPSEVKVKLKSGAVTGDLGDISHTEIDNVVKSRSGLYRTCYQKQLNRFPNLAGKLVVRFRISPTGTVKSAKVVGAKSSLRNGAVEDCVLRHIKRLSFPAKGGALVNYPLFFSKG